MTARTRIFDRFNPHALCEIVEYDAATPSLLVRNHDGSRERHAVQPGLRLQASTLQPGRTVAVQFGQIVGKGHSTATRRGIAAMQHLIPRTDVLSLAIVRAYATDPDETLRQFVEGANTRVTQGVETGVDPCTKNRAEIAYAVNAGMLKASVQLGLGAHLRDGVLTIEGALPDTVVATLAGRRLAEIVRHPVVIDPRIVIRSVEPVGMTPDLITSTRIRVDSPSVELARHGEQINLHFAV